MKNRITKIYLEEENMPSCCNECPFVDDFLSDEVYCVATNSLLGSLVCDITASFLEKKPDDCPLKVVSSECTK